MYGNGTDVVWMGLERRDFLGSVVVVYAELEVIGTCRHYSSITVPSKGSNNPTRNNPVLSRNEPTRSDGDVGEFEGFNNRLRLKGPDIHMAWAYVSIRRFLTVPNSIPLYNVVRIHGSVG